MRHALPLILVTLCATCLATPAEAKDLRNRFGVGFDSSLNAIPAVSVKYTFPASDKAINIALEGLAGVQLPAQGDTGFMAGGRFLYTVVAEDQMNLYLGLGSFYLNTNTLEGQFQGVRVQGLMGAEVFLYGLDNLGLSLEVGVNADLGGGTVGLATESSALGGLGLHYYF